MEIPRRKKIIIILSWTMVILWMGVIFGLSAQPAAESGALSHGVTEMLVNFVKRMVPSADISVEGLHHFVRKNAHFFAYMILALLVSHAFSRHEMHGMENFWNTLLICVLYAVSDELHQLLVPGRGASVVDVMIDSMGVLAGLLLYYFSHVTAKRAVRYE